MGEPRAIVLPVGKDGRINIQPDPSVMMEASKKDRLEQRVPKEIRKLEEIADFVDRTILNVNTGQESNIMKTTDQSIFLHLKVPKLRERIAAINTIEERVRCAKEFFSWVPIRKEILNKFQKNALASSAFREKGNEFFKRKNYKDALHYYTMSALFAGNEDKELGMAFANRSAVFVELNDPEAALTDIESALTHNYPKSSEEKLEQRKFKCQELIRKKAEDKEKNKDLMSQVEKEIKSRRFVRDKMLKIEKPNPLMTAAAECVEIKYDNAMGRHLVVNRDVPAGSLLIVEDPFIFVLFGQSKWDTNHCYGCLKRITQGIPCPSCVFALYCDESCMTKAEKVHKYECNCLSYFHINKFPEYLQMSFRIICKLGPSELFRLFTTKDPEYFDLQKPFGTEPGCEYKTDSYLPVFHLLSHADKQELMPKCMNAHGAHLLATILEKQTDFFQNIPADCRDDFKDFVATLLLRHIDNGSVNTGSLVEVKGMEDISLEDCYGDRIDRKGLGRKVEDDLAWSRFGQALYPTFSLMNHSCDPNVYPVTDLVNGTVSVIACRKLKKGEPMFLTYVRDFPYQPYEHRQNSLQDSYSFKCQCVACKHHWPLITEMNARKPIFCCPDCSKLFYEFEKGSDQFKKCVLTKPRWKCGRCGKKYKDFELTRDYEEKEKIAAAGADMFLLNRPREAMLQILKVAEYFQYHLYAPDAQHYINQENLRRIMMLIYYYSQ